MGKSTTPDPAKLIIGLIFKNEEFLIKALGILRRSFGEIDYESPVYPFTYSDYYEKEIGRNLQRKFVSFRKLVSPEQLAAIKVVTNKIEGRLSQAGSRRVNIDPGYLTLAKLVLASTKDYSHRVYINKGIFAEITLGYREKSFHPQPWTYPDYRSQEYIEVFLKIRDIYAKQIKKI
jgi:hypothetical protein